MCAAQVSGAVILQQSGGGAGCEGEGGGAFGRRRPETADQSRPAQRDLGQSDQPARAAAVLQRGPAKGQS